VQYIQFGDISIQDNGIYFIQPESPFLFVSWIKLCHFSEETTTLQVSEHTRTMRLCAKNNSEPVFHKERGSL
jgi:hypothetical protein